MLVADASYPSKTSPADPDRNHRDAEKREGSGIT